MTMIQEYLGDPSKSLLSHTCTGIPRERLHLPGADVLHRIHAASDRSNRVLGNLSWLIHTGRLSGPGGGGASASLLVVTLFPICLLLALRICIAGAPANCSEAWLEGH